MNYRLHAGDVRPDVNIALPVSKSVVNRLLTLQFLSESKLTLPPGELPNDVLLLHRLFTGTGEMRSAEDAGTVMRFGAAALAVSTGNFQLTGTPRMHQRPIGELVRVLNDLGADIRFVGEKGFPPLSISGKQLKGGRVEIDAGISSQFLSAVLLVAPLARQPIELQWKGEVVSRPYVQLTLDLMRAFGAEFEQRDQGITVFATGYRKADCSWEYDWSSAAFFFSLCALNNGMTCFLKGLRASDLQGDRAVVDLFAKLGVKSEFQKGGLMIRNTERIEASTKLSIDFTAIPDLVQPFVMCCAAMQLPLELSGLYNLHLKETDRLEALSWNVAQLGGDFRVNGTSASLIPGASPNGKVNFRVFGDHRMAMSLAPLVSKLKEIELNDVESVKKSYPGFWTELQKTGISVTEIK